MEVLVERLVGVPFTPELKFNDTQLNFMLRFSQLVHMLSEGLGMRIYKAISSMTATVLAATMVSVAPAQAIAVKLRSEGGVEYCGFFAEKSVQEDYKRLVRLYEREVTAAYKKLRDDLQQNAFIWNHINSLELPPAKENPEIYYNFGRWNSESFPPDFNSAEIDTLLADNNIGFEPHLSLEYKLQQLPWYAYVDKEYFEQVMALRIKEANNSWVYNGPYPEKVAVYQIDGLKYNLQGKRGLPENLTLFMPMLRGYYSDQKILEAQVFTAEMKQLENEIIEKLQGPESTNDLLGKCAEESRKREQQNSSVAPSTKSESPKQTQKPDAPETKNSQS
ncbi:MAG: hypothetical protein Q4A92_12065, partial [Corynebacterium sp.]|nr:hypothetical protein [Corynebacterium sp.]